MLSNVKRTAALPALVLALAGLSACSSEDPGAGGDTTGGTTGGGPYTGPTFHKDIAPILQKNCQSCHRPGDIAPFSLVTYEEAAAAAPLMVAETKARTMPPWGAMETAECKPRFGWKDDLRLSDADIKLIEDWQKAGAPEGDPKEAPAPIQVPSSELPNKTQELFPKTPYVTSGSSDEFICFTFDPKLTKESYLNGTGFVPGNPKVVHHILLFSDPMNEGEAQDAADGKADGSYRCFGGPGIGGAKLIAAWAPGGVPNNLPPEVGMTMAAGERLIMQIHYHPAGATADPDNTAVQLRFMDTKPPYTLFTNLIGNAKGPVVNGTGLLPGPNDGVNGPQFFIPALASGHTETMVTTVPEKINGVPTPQFGLFFVGAHMHIVGVDEKIDIERAAGSPDVASECLLHEPKWNFAWQRGYGFDAPLDGLPRVGPGDKITLRCTYDNTLNNEALMGGLKEQNLAAPVDVTLGESTLEEMCLSALGLVLKTGP